jgi:hypothetical protein
LRPRNRELTKRQVRYGYFGSKCYSAMRAAYHKRVYRVLGMEICADTQQLARKKLNGREHEVRIVSRTEIDSDERKPSTLNKVDGRSLTQASATSAWPTYRSSQYLWWS